MPDGVTSLKESASGRDQGARRLAGRCPSGPVPGTTASPSHVPLALSGAEFLLILPSHDRGAGPGACSGLGLGPQSLPRRPLLLRPPAAGSGTVGRPEALVLPGHERSQLFPPVPETRVFRFALAGYGELPPALTALRSAVAPLPQPDRTWSPCPSSPQLEARVPPSDAAPARPSTPPS
ncbi:unnamed protein product [Rangifer tarandus platyrhynchus]|uniref:Uncharacterized protein n=1 Tax=Rangifer tarandus platyrhynchus TaxID=3082113 RepID=A0ABN9A1W4_RANTA|nr:unnamed protein product [Rangifer tarandus platyrhynchus]